jgi:LPS-assembly lipoprotein
MWWPRVSRGTRRGVGPAVRIASLFGLSALLTGCFQPLYGDRSPTGGPTVRTELAQVDIAQISAPNGTPLSRLAVEVRNSLVFGFTGGGYAPPPTHKLDVQLATSEFSVLVDIRTGRPDVNNVALNAVYKLTDLRTGKIVLTDQTFARVSYDIPGQQQRFARQRGLRDAENRAAKQIAENIQTRLASYFVAGT